MKRIWITLYCCVITMHLVGQINLVPNPSFETPASCDPFNGGFWATDWVNPTAYSPDYYNECWPDSIIMNSHDVPCNPYGFQIAKTGVAYYGIITAFIGNNDREYIQAELTDTLKGGYKYRVSFQVCLADSSPYAVNNCGVYFSVAPISSAQLTYLPLIPQIENNSANNPLTIPNTWIEISDSFVANGGEKFITIGNFRNDANTDTFNLNNGSTVQYGYYFLDDVSVVLCDSGVGINENTINEKIQIFPNPNNGFLTIKSNLMVENEISIFNILGKLILIIKLDTSQNENKIDITGLTDGLYIARIKLKNAETNIKLFLTKRKK